MLASKSPSFPRGVLSKDNELYNLCCLKTFPRYNMKAQYLFEAHWGVETGGWVFYPTLWQPSSSSVAINNCLAMPTTQMEDTWWVFTMKNGKSTQY